MPKIPLGPPPTPPARPPRNRPPPPPPTLFEQLLPCSWRGVSFPVSSIRISLAQDLVEHKYWGVDGASVEATGRAPMQIEAEIPFLNGIVPGKGEKWGVLFPTGFGEFRKAMADRTKGDLVHPDLDVIICKPVSFDYAIDAQRRDGVIVTARWIESLENVETAFDASSPIEAADLAALDLDASKADILALAPDAAFPEESFDSFINKVSGAIDSVGTTATLLAAKPGQLLNRVKTLQASVERTRNALTWPLTDACERMKQALHAILPTQTVVGTGPAASVAPSVPPGRKIGRYVTQSPMTLAAIASVLPKPNSVDDLVRLNPFLVARPQVGAGTVIRFYA